MQKQFSKITVFSSLAMMVIGLVALGGAMGVFWSQSSSESSIEEAHLANVQNMILNADSATRGKAMSLATGRISEDVEGLFVLDHLTGMLSCIVLSPRSGEAGALFVTNVNEHLGIAKAGDQDFLMTTGFINSTGGRGGQQRPAECVVYVADGNSGQVAAYSLLYNKQAIDNAVGQKGTLDLLWKGASRPEAARRDQD